MYTMVPKVQNKNTYKDKVKLDLERIKTNDVNTIKIDLFEISEITSNRNWNPKSRC